MDGWMDTYGNVKAQSSCLVSDARGSNAPHTSTDSFTITGYEPAIKSITDYYPFGMQMPDRCYSDGTTHTTNISAVTTVPVHHMVNRVWPDGRDSAIGGAIILTGSSPLGLVASGTETLSYELPRYIGGLLHTVRIFTHGTVPPGFRAEISMGGTSSSTTSFSGISTDLMYTPTSISVPYLHIYNLGMRDTIFIDSVHIDSATYEPYHVLSSISSSDGYAYGFNGQMKVNEWAGSGNHNTALFWEYGTREARRMNVDPVINPSVSPYAVFDNSPIWKNDPKGAYPSPIYDQKGSFLGTDDQGLQGKTIVMKKDDFSQGMKHEDALTKDLAPNGVMNFLKQFLPIQIMLISIITIEVCKADLIMMGLLLFRKV